MIESIIFENFLLDVLLIMIFPASIALIVNIKLRRIFMFIYIALPIFTVSAISLYYMNGIEGDNIYVFETKISVILFYTIIWLIISLIPYFFVRHIVNFIDES